MASVLLQPSLQSSQEEGRPGTRLEGGQEGLVLVQRLQGQEEGSQLEEGGSQQEGEGSRQEGEESLQEERWGGQVLVAHGGPLDASLVVPSPPEGVSSPQGNSVSRNQEGHVSSHRGMGASSRPGVKEASSRPGVGVSSLEGAPSHQDDDPSRVGAGPWVPSREEDASSAPTLQVGLAPSLQAEEVPTLHGDAASSLRAAAGPTPLAAEAIHQAEGGPSHPVAEDPSLVGACEAEVHPHLVV